LCFSADICRSGFESSFHDSETFFNLFLERASGGVYNRKIELIQQIRQRMEVNRDGG
jgi:hypothetical protein